MKRIASLSILLLIMSLISMPAYAQGFTNIKTLDDMYEEAFNTAMYMSGRVIEDDYSAYAFILNHSAIAVEDNKIVLPSLQLPSDESALLQNFVSRLNTLLNLSAISIDESLRIFAKEASSIEVNTIPKATVISFMPETRRHAVELRAVYDNAVFTMKHIIAGEYFKERVKSGGIWDYKIPLGYSNVYYEPELQAYMTGETIGNFHYGYVGSTIFEPITLKSAAGLAQIGAGTMDWSFWSSYFDDPKDIENIEWGIDVYNREN